MKVHLGLASGTSMIEGTNATTLVDSMNMLKTVEEAGKRSEAHFKGASCLSCIFSIQFFPPLLPFVPPPTADINPTLGEELRHFSWEMAEVGLRTSTIHTFHSNQFKPEFERVQVPYNSQVQSDYLYRTFERTKDGQILAQNTKSEYLRHFHSRASIATPFSISRLEKTKGLAMTPPQRH